MDCCLWNDANGHLVLWNGNWRWRGGEHPARCNCSGHPRLGYGMERGRESKRARIDSIRPPAAGQPIKCRREHYGGLQLTLNLGGR